MMHDYPETIDRPPCAHAGAAMNTGDGQYQPAIWSADGGYRSGYVTDLGIGVAFGAVEGDRDRARVMARRVTAEMTRAG